MWAASHVSVGAQIAIATRFGLGVVFALSSITKLRHPAAFARDIIDYEILSAPAATALAFALLPFEAFLAAALLTGILAQLALFLCAGVLTVFLVAVGLNLRRGRHISCGCFGQSSETISRRSLVRLLLMQAAVIGLIVIANFAPRALPNLLLLSANGATLAYVLETASFAVFMVLMGAWIVNLPDLRDVARQFALGVKNSV